MLKTIKLFIKDSKLTIQKHLSKYYGKDHPWFQYYENVPKFITYPNKSLYDLVNEQAIKTPNAKAYQYFKKKVKYKKFNKQIIECAKGLREIGIKKGDIVSICMTNTPDAVIFFYAVNMVGGVANMIHPLASEKEMKLYFEKSNSKYILALDLVYEKLKIVDKDINFKKIIISKINNKMPLYMAGLYEITKKPPKIKYDDKTISFKMLNKLGKNNTKDPKAIVRGREDAVIVYSGGTTGNPKGVVLTNLNVNAMALQAYKMLHPINEGDSVLATLPIFHNFGLIVSIHTSVTHNIKAILVPGFNAKDFAKLIKKNKPNFIVGVPTMYEALINTDMKQKKFMKNVHTVVVGGDLLNKTLAERVNKYLIDHGCKATIRMGYGLSETSGACSLTPRNYFEEGGIGIPFPDMLFKIINHETNEELKPNEVGEICIYGPTVMSRYLNDIRETKNVLKLHNDGKLWLHTGDMGYMNEEGMIFFKSRLKRMIVSNGYNIYPQYLETQVMQHPAVDTCTVIGVPHKYKQMVPHAYIILKKNFLETDILKDEIKTFCEQRINNFEKIDKYIYVKELPQTLMGKVAFTKITEEGEE